ncbi:MAG: anthranilate phosphoribosyltransferase [Candidatus Dormibacteria bacterium]|jgi:anthranilate phosphoribosyltransferase
MAIDGANGLPLREILEEMLARVDLGADRSRELGDALMEGALSPSQMGAVLSLWRAKGETVAELVGLVSSMMSHCVRVELGRDAVDTCGTGGDRLGTFNISTAAAMVVAGAGLPVAKHGNRAASSRCGSADVLEALGVVIDLNPAGVRACVEEAGMGFMFAPSYHPSMRHVAAPRRELGIRTVFNILGPLANPAQVPYQALGVSSPVLAEQMARVLAGLGRRRAVVFSGPGGLDELGLDGLSVIWQVADGEVVAGEVNPSELGLEPAPSSALVGGDASENAAALVRVLEGERGPKRDVVLLNAAAALVAGDRARDFAEGLAMARTSLDQGAARQVLGRLVATSRKVSS